MISTRKGNCSVTTTTSSQGQAQEPPQSPTLPTMNEENDTSKQAVIYQEAVASGFTQIESTDVNSTDFLKAAMKTNLKSYVVAQEELEQVLKYFEAFYSQKCAMETSFLDTIEESIKAACAIVEYFMLDQTKIGDSKKKLVENFIYDSIQKQGHIMSDTEKVIISQYIDTVFSSWKTKLVRVFRELFNVGKNVCSKAV